MVTDIEIIISPSILVDCSITLVIVKNHASLENLDYAHSGHTGFASSADINNLKEQVPALQATATVVVNALTNINGRILSNYEATLHPADPYVVQYTYYTITYHGSELTEEQARNYMEYMTGSRYLPGFNYEKPKNSLFVFADGSFWKPQYSEGSLKLYQIPNPFALNAALFNGNILKSSIIPDEFDEIIEFEKEVSGSNFLANALATDPGTVVWCAATKAYAGDTYYRKFIVNNDGTQAGLTTFNPKKGKLYVGKTANALFNWSGSNLLEVSKSLALGETASTAYVGNKGKANAQAIAQLQEDLTTKQDVLVSGTNIKTVNGVSVLGNGNVTIPGEPLTRILKYYSGMAFTAEEIQLLKNCQAYVEVTYGGGTSSGSRIYFPTNNYLGQSKLYLASVTGKNGFYVMEINTVTYGWTETYKAVSSPLYKHEIVVPDATWYYQNSSNQYLKKIIFYSKDPTVVTDTDSLFTFLENNEIVGGKIFSHSDSTTPSYVSDICESFDFYFSKYTESGNNGYRKIINHPGTNSNYWYNAPSTPITLTDTVTLF